MKSAPTVPVCARRSVIILGTMYHIIWTFLVVRGQGRPPRQRLPKTLTRDLRRAVNDAMERERVSAADIAKPPTGKWIRSRSDEWVYRAIRENDGQLAVDVAVELLLRLHANGVSIAERFAKAILEAAHPTAEFPLVLVPKGEAKLLARYLAEAIASSEMRRRSREDIEIAIFEALIEFERFRETGKEQMGITNHFTFFVGQNALGRKKFYEMLRHLVETHGDATVTEGPYTRLRRLYVERGKRKSVG